MLRRRHGAMHRNRHTLAFEPVDTFRTLDPVASWPRVLDQVEALVKAVAAEFRICGGSAFGNHLISRLHDIEPAKFERIDLQIASEFVHETLDEEIGLPHSVAPDRARRHHVGVNGIAINFLVWAAIYRDRLTAGGV